MILSSRRSVMAGLLASAALPATVRADSGTLADDLPILARAYGLLHPGLYRYQTPQLWQERLDRTASEVGRAPTLSHQYALLARLSAGLKCGHSYANFFNQSKAVADAIIAPANKVPFHFIWIGNRMVVTANPSGLGGLERGTEILTINGVPAAEVQARLLPYVRADGNNDAKRRKLLDVEAKSRIETFDVLYPVVFGATTRFDLSVRPPHGAAIRSLTVGAIDQATREAQASAGFDSGIPEYWQLDYPAARVARITMPGWALYDEDWDWRARIDDFFEDMAAKNASSLIIDIRDNEGGLDCGHEIIAHLIDQDLSLTNLYERRVRFRTTPEDLRPYLDTWDRSFDTLGEGEYDLGDGFFRLTPPDGVGVIKPKGSRFKGRVIVLSGPENSSATFQFISLMKSYNLGRIYGQTTGGNQRGINGGAFFFLRLPASGLEVDLPLIGTFPTRALPDAGIDPDVFVEPRVEDIASNIDAVLARALFDLS